MMLLLLLSIVGVPLLPWAFRCYRRYVERGNSFLFLNKPECISNNLVEFQHHKIEFHHPKILKYTRIKHNGISKTRLVTMPHRVNITGEGIRSMSLTFEGVPDYQRWIQHVGDVRNKAAYIMTLLVQARVIYLLFTWIPLADLLVQDWGNDFVPSDITDNIVEARQFLDQQPPPNPALLRILRELRTKELHAALRRFDKER